MGGILGICSELVGDLGLEFLKGGSEKGSTRKHTGNRVTSWISLFWRNLEVSR
jgi:hypothetical protein